MTPAASILISDSRSALARLLAAEASKDRIAAAFAAWLSLPIPGLPPLSDLAAAAAAKTGAARGYAEVATLGFSVTRPPLAQKFGAEFAKRLEWLIGCKLTLGSSPSPVLHDPVAIFGISLGVESALTDEAKVKARNWLVLVAADSAKLSDGRWPSPIAALLSGQTGVPEWVCAGLAGLSPSHAPKKPDLVKILRDSSFFDETTVAAEAALKLAAIDWARERTFSMDLASLAVNDVLTILSRTGEVFTRWVWEEKGRTAGSEPRRWHIENEYHFQSLLFAVAKPCLPELEEEKYLENTAQLQPRADLALPSLKLVVEVKFWKRGQKVSKIIEEIAADVTLYLKTSGPYDSLIVAIWDDAARTEEHAELQRGLKKITGICGVIIVNRPSLMSEVGLVAPKKVLKPKNRP